MTVIPTISASLELFDKFSQRIDVVNKAVDVAVRGMDRLRSAMQSDVTLGINTKGLEQMAATPVHQPVHDAAIEQERLNQEIAKSKLLEEKLQAAMHKTKTAEQQIATAISNTKLAEEKLTAAVNQTRITEEKLKAAAEQTQRVIQRSQQQQSQMNDRINGQMRNSESSSFGFLNNMRGILAAYLSIAAIHKGIEFMNWSDSIASANARLALMNDGTQSQLQLQQKVMKVANDTRQAYGETAKMVAQLGSSTQGVFKNNNEILAFTSRFNKLLVTGGSNAEESKSAILQMSQALSSGVLQGDELRSLSETAPMLMKVLADGLGVARGQLKQMGADGELTSDKIVKAFEKQDAYINQLFSKMPVTFGQAMTVAKNRAAEWIATLNGANGPLQKVTQSVMNFVAWMDTKQGQSFFDGIGAGISLLANGISVFTNFMIQNMDIVKNVLLGVIIVLAAVAIQSIITWVAAAWPIFAVIGAIALLLTVLNRFGVSTQTVIGVVIGLFNSLFAFIWNKVAFIWNLFLAFGEFLANFFIDPIYAIEKLFYDLAMLFMGHMYTMLRSAEGFAGGFMSAILEGINGAIGGVNKLLKAISKIPGMGNIDPISPIDATNIHALSDGLKSMMDSLKAPTSDKNVIDLSKYKMNEKNLADSYNAGKKFGGDLLAKAGNALDGLAQKGDAWSGNGPNINKVNEVGKIGDTVDISSEDLKVMRDLAEMKAIQNFVTLTPTVQVTTGPITKDVDVDEVIKKIVNVVDSEIESSAQGVYG